MKFNFAFATVALVLGAASPVFADTTHSSPPTTTPTTPTGISISGGGLVGSQIQAGFTSGGSGLEQTGVATNTTTGTAIINPTTLTATTAGTSTSSYTINGVSSEGMGDHTTGGDSAVGVGTGWVDVNAFGESLTNVGLTTGSAAPLTAPTLNW